MKLVSFRERSRGAAGGWHPGVLRSDGSVVDLSGRELGEVRVDSLRQVLEGGERGLSLARQAVEGDDPGIAADDVLFGPPVTNPDKVICIGLNYLEHAGEVDMELPPAPILFPKFRNSLIGDGDEILIPPVTSEVDYEGELAIVIGEWCKDVPEESALDVVAGYMPFNDVSARDVQMQTSQWTAGKALDTFAPCGPALVTADEIDDPQDLNLRTLLNGEEVQHSNTSLMIFPVVTLISFITSLMTLEPGDIIATGTPSGVGFTREPPLFMAEGDEVAVEIERVGVLRNPVRRI